MYSITSTMDPVVLWIFINRKEEVNYSITDCHWHVGCLTHIRQDWEENPPTHVPPPSHPAAASSSPRQKTVWTVYTQ